MSSQTGFILFLALTLVALGVVVATGLRARRRVHLVFVALAVGLLATTIYFAERLGELFDLTSAGVLTPVHLAIAKVTVVAYLLPLATGWRTLKNPRMRRWHRKAAFLVLGLTILTAVTGSLMIFLAERLPPPN